MLLMRLVVIASGTGFILTPRRWLARMKDATLRKLQRSRVIGT
jgi:hypothetical protein